MITSGIVAEEADRQRFIAMIGVEADRMIRLINDILKISELETVAAPDGESAPMLRGAEEVAELLRPTAGDVEITVDGTECCAGLSAGRLRELLMNLMVNAVKYNVPDGCVHVTVGRAEQAGRVFLRVEDTGIGIPEEAQSHVFERFYRVDKGRSKKAGGTGLGLSIVKHITALYGGTIELSSTVGEGTTVTITLPEGET